MGLIYFLRGVFETMQVEITLETSDTAVVFIADFESDLPDIICIDNKYHYCLAAGTKRPTIINAVYKPATIAHLSEPENAQVFKKAQG